MAIEKYRDFILVADDVEKDEEGVLRFSVEVFTSPRGGGVRVEKQQITTDLRKELGRLERRKLDADGIISLGEKLAALLLPGQVGEFFKGSLDMLKAGQGLRLRLRLDPALAGFPWEYMYVPRTGGERDSTGFVVLDPRVSVARHDAMPIPGDFDDTPKKRRLLVALASPEDQAPLDLDRERDNLKEALRDVPGIDLDFVENATIQTLADELLPGADIFHFAGHGTFGRAGAEARYGADDGEGAILLVAEDGSAAPMPAEELAVNLRGRGVQLVVLGACETGRRGEGSVWSGVAAALMKAGIPASVAMQYSIWDDAAIAFNRSLYRALAVGFPLDYAVSAGRLAAFNRCHPVREDPELGKCYRDWGVPVLYLRSEQDFVLPAIPDPTKREDVARKVDDEVGPPPRRRPPWQRWVFSAVIASAGTAAVAGGLFLFRVLPLDNKIPYVIGLTTDQAYLELEESGFDRKEVVEEEEFDSEKPVGIIVDQDPGKGDTLARGSKITLVVSKGPRIIPGVIDLTKEEAYLELAESGFYRSEVIEEEFESNKPEGIIVKQDPVEGGKLAEGGKIKLYISTRPPDDGEENGPDGEVIIQDYTGQSFRRGLSGLRAAGFDVVVRKAPSYTVDRYNVISQTPVGEVDADTKEVTLTVSVGRFCPHGCGTELELDWDHCEGCGGEWPPFPGE
jgi:beta-lactam-binding protein with PASTA domain